jgi:hypothetical protein
VGEDGALSLDPRSPFGDTAPLFGVATVRVGKRLFVYAAEYDLDRLRGFELQDDGALVELPSSPFAAGDGPNGIAAAKRLVFAPSEDGFVTSYVVESDGSLAPSGPPLELAPPAVSIFNATPDAKGKLLYVADDGFDDPVGGADLPPAVYAFRVDRRTAALRPVAGSPFATSLPLLFANGASTAKKLVVVVGFEAGAADLQVFRIGRKGVLAPLGPLQDSGLGALAHALDPKGRWLLVASAAEVRASQIDGRTGLVTHLGPGSRQPLGGGAEPNAIVVLSR